MRGTDNWYHYAESAWSSGKGGDATLDLLVATPYGYDDENTYNWVFMQYGRNGSSASFDPWGTAGLMKEVSNWFLWQNYVVVAAMAGSADHWGNDAALANIELSYQKAIADYSLAATAIIGGVSMGGISALLALAANPARYSRCLLFNPTASLDYSHENGYTTAINTAYGCTTETYDAATVGHRPEDMWATFAAAAIPYWLIHGDADTTVNISVSQGFVAGVNAETPDLAVLTTVAGANHSTVQLFDAFAADAETWLSISRPADVASGRLSMMGMG